MEVSRDKSTITSSQFGPLIGSIDEGTTSARFLLFKAETSEVVCSHKMEIEMIRPQEGWSEQDPAQIMKAVNECISKTVKKLQRLGGKVEVSRYIEINWFIFAYDQSS